jgi:N-acetylglucosamine-6-phosphate deacetylase
VALRNLVQSAGLDPAVAVRLATLNPARAMGLEGTIGRMEVGRGADLALLDGDWQVQATIAGGSIAYLAGDAGAGTGRPG